MKRTEQQEFVLFFSGLFHWLKKTPKQTKTEIYKLIQNILIIKNI